MSDIILKDPKEEGSVVVIALMILVVLTLLGIMATRTATTDIRIAASEISYKTNFYIAEAAVNREALEIGRGNYPVVNINAISPPAPSLAEDTDTNLPGDAHTFGNVSYEFSVDYKGYFLPPTGYSVIHFSRYDYRVDANTPAPDTVRVASRYYKIGPKASQ
jgi:PilX N-terminal